MKKLLILTSAALLTLTACGRNIAPAPDMPELSESEAAQAEPAPTDENHDQ